MPTIPQSDLPRPKSWDEFEDIVWNIYSREWHDPHAERNGRSGQRQHGVDIYGQPREMGGRYAGIQCKRFAEGRLTQQAVEREVAEAEDFSPPLAEYTIATTESRDAAVQEVVRQIDEERRQADKFRLYLVFWETLCDRLSDPGNADLLQKHYGDWLRRDSYTAPPPPDPNVVPEPGALPPGSRLPFPRNVLFTGRLDPLKDLARALLHGGTASTLVTQAIAGMGGVGKTQLAVEFAYRYGRYFRGVHWLNAARPEMLAAEVAECGLAMGLPGWPDEQPERVACTLRGWSEGGPRLVVLDNLEEVEAAREWLARLGGGGVRVLLTARRTKWPDDLGLEPLALKVFPVEESRVFLRRYLSDKRASDAELDALAERLGRLPLALELAGRYLKSLPRLSVGSYLDRLANAFAHPSMKNWLAELGNPTGHDLDLAATFAVSWERVTDEAARRVFMMAGWCAPNQPIPPEVVQQAAGLDEAACDEAAGILTGLGLLEWDDPHTGPAIHPLLAEFSRGLDAETAEREGGERALGAVAQALVQLSYEANETGLPARFVPLRAHVEAVAGWAQGARLQQAGTLWNNLGYYRNMVADYGAARAAVERALAIDEQVCGAEHPVVARNVNSLGAVLQALGDLAGARVAFERALQIDERIYGPDHPKIAIRVNNLGSVLLALGDLPGAWDAFERALRIDERTYGPDHSLVAIRTNNLGLVLRALGNLAGARSAFERALAIDERVYGTEHPAVARDVNSLGGVLQALGDLAGARVAFERALQIDERIYGPDHPKVAIRVSNLGGVLRALGDLTGAWVAYERALEIDERGYGPDHPNVATDVNNLGSVLQDLGDLTGARAAFERALGIREKVFGREHPDTALTLWWLGTLATQAGDIEEARSYLEEALRTFGKNLPAGHSTIAQVRRDLDSLG